MTSGLSIGKTCEILDVCESYIYKLIKRGQLEAIGKTPMTIAPSSVISKICSDYPFLKTNMFSTLDYTVKREAIDGTFR